MLPGGDCVLGAVDINKSSIFFHICLEISRYVNSVNSGLHMENSPRIDTVHTLCVYTLDRLGIVSDG